MQITLDPKLEEFIQEQLDSGRFRVADDVVALALRQYAEREERREQLLESINEGFAQIERGEGVELTYELRQEMIQTAIRRARAGEKPHPDVCP